MNPLGIHLAAAALFGAGPAPQKSAKKRAKPPVLGPTPKRATIKAARKAKHRRGK